MTLLEIQLMVEQHPAVIHPLIKRLSHNPNDRLGWQTFAQQHHLIVREFPWHVKALFSRLSPREREILHPVLADEFPPETDLDTPPERSAHAGLQYDLCMSLGVEPPVNTSDYLPAVRNFVTAHRAMALDMSIDFVLGVFGPGHEYAVPVMFRQLVSGAPPYVNPRYMFEHLDIDVEHAKRFFEILENYDLKAVADGAMASLELRALAWTSILHRIETTELNA